VLEGTVRAIIGGVERRYEAGKAFEVPTGVPHQMAAEGPARTRWEVRPALRTAEFSERLLAAAGGTAGASSIPDVLAEFSEEIRLTGA
jgi:hypothetical protein